MILTIYVPKNMKFRLASLVAAGSAIVGVPAEVPAYDGQTIIYFEGAIHNPQAFDYADALHVAAGRLSERYPTTARGATSRESLVPIGKYDTRERTYEIFNQELLDAWLATRSA